MSENHGCFENKSQRNLSTNDHDNSFIHITDAFYVTSVSLEPTHKHLNTHSSLLRTCLQRNIQRLLQQSLQEPLGVVPGHNVAAAVNGATRDSLLARSLRHRRGEMVSAGQRVSSAMEVCFTS